MHRVRNCIFREGRSLQRAQILPHLTFIDDPLCARHTGFILILTHSKPPPDRDITLLLQIRKLEPREAQGMHPRGERAVGGASVSLLPAWGPSWNLYPLP